MDIQTLVNRIEEMRISADKMTEIASDKNFYKGKISAEFYQGEALGYLRLLIWLQDNGIAPDTN